jgi:signal transduction histidine kinase
MFERPSTTSGSGLGLSLAMKLAARMSGGLTVLEVPSGFAVEVLLPSSVAPSEAYQR